MTAESPQDVIFENITVNGERMHSDIGKALIAANLKRTIDGSPTVTLQLHDPHDRLVTAGFFAQRDTIQIDGKGFELVQINKSADTLTLTFEDVAVSEMRRHTDPAMQEAGVQTRLEFAQTLLAEDGTAWIKIYVSPGATLEKTKVQLARGTVPSPNANSNDVNQNYYGASTNTANGGVLSASDVATYAAQAGFAGGDLITAVAVCKGESKYFPGAVNRPGDGNEYYGLMQIQSAHKALLDKYHNNWQDPLSNMKMAYELYAAAKGFKPWETYTNTRSPVYYKQYLAEAQAAVSGTLSLKDPATGTALKFSPKQRNRNAREKLLGGAEDTWECIKRIFAEINWTVYVDYDADSKPSIYVGPDDNFASSPPIEVTKDSQGVDSIDYDYDIGKSTATMTMRCRAHRWQLPPGTVVKVPLPGHLNPWLVSSVERSMHSTQCTVSLKKPEPALPEPEGTQQGGTLGDYYGDGNQLSQADPNSPSTAELGGGVTYHWPVTGDHKITDKFGTPRPGGKHHQGIDIAASIGTPVYASRDGVIESADETFDPKGYGKLVRIIHGPEAGIPHAGSEETYYAHLSVIAATRGAPVKQGDLIGKSGISGDAQGPHLHFEIRKNGTPVDPLPILTLTGGTVSTPRFIGTVPTPRF